MLLFDDLYQSGATASTIAAILLKKVGVKLIMYLAVTKTRTYMSTVFIGGSINIKKLDDPVKKRLDTIIEKNFGILIGDANGMDFLVQQYLYEHHYRDVHVFCINESRNNVGSWPLHIVKTQKTRLTRDDYMKKDARMAQEAQYGFMIWDGKSAGTVNNVLNLVFEKKKCFVYCEWIKKFETVSNSQDIRYLI